MSIDASGVAPTRTCRTRAFSSLGHRSDSACADMAPILGSVFAPHLRDVKLPPDRPA
jgi:hypothetical protein